MDIQAVGDILQNENLEFRIIFQLHKDLAPKASENFIRLCEGKDLDLNKTQNLTYKGTTFTKFFKDFYLQGGDVDSKGGQSVFGKFFEDETK
jgi:peptidyl-prolyl isomerase D